MIRVEDRDCNLAGISRGYVLLGSKQEVQVSSNRGQFSIQPKAAKRCLSPTAMRNDPANDHVSKLGSKSLPSLSPEINTLRPLLNYSL